MVFVWTCVGFVSGLGPVLSLSVSWSRLCLLWCGLGLGFVSVSSGVVFVWSCVVLGLGLVSVFSGVVLVWSWFWSWSGRRLTLCWSWFSLCLGLGLVSVFSGVVLV